MELNRKRSKVIMLPTEQLSQVVLNTYITNKHNCSKLQFNSIPKFTNEDAKSMGFEYQHLYFITDDEIKEGDWYLVRGCNEIRNNSGDATIERTINKYKKIIATTDKLKIGKEEAHGQICPLGLDDSDKYINKYLPQPSEAFIQKYCEIGGIDEVDIECNHPHNDANWQIEKGYFELTLKVDSHNTITIHPIKNSWDREEVIELVNNFAIQFVANTDTAYKQKDIADWIEENLK